jgi:phosphorylcholine metabolism protein LicD
MKKKIKLIFELKRLIKKALFVINQKAFREFNSFPVNNNGVLTSEAVKDLKRCCEKVTSLNLNYRLADGTILGIYRDGRLIPHDNDIDIDVLVTPELDEQKIHEEFTAMGFRLGRKVYFKNKIQQMAYFNKYTYDIFDMIFWYLDGNSVVNYSEKNFERSQEVKYFDVTSTIQFQGKDYPAPANLDDWLVMRYGSDWKIPKTFKSDWKKECFDLQEIKI